MISATEALATEVQAALTRCQALFDMKKPDSLPEAQRKRDYYLERAAHWRKMLAITDDTDKLLSFEALAQANEEAAEAFVALINESGKSWTPYQADLGPTVEARNKPGRTSPLLVLFDLEYINKDQLRHGNEIAQVFQAVVAALMPKAGKMQNGARIGSGNFNLASHMSTTLAGLYSRVYKPWTELVEPDLELCIDLIVDGISIDAAKHKHRCRWETVAKRLRRSLDIYDRLRHQYRESERQMEREHGIDIAVGTEQ